MSTLLPQELKLTNLARRNYRPDAEDSYVLGTTKQGKKRLKKYTFDSNLFVPIFPTPDVNINTKGIKNLNDLSNLQELSERIKEGSRRELKSKYKYKNLSNIHTHPITVPNVWIPGKTTDISSALKPPSAPDLISLGTRYRHPKVQGADYNSSLIYTKENGKDVVYKYDLPEKDKQRFQRISYQESLDKPLKTIFNDLPAAMKYTTAELYGGGLGSAASQVKHVLTNLHRPKRLYEGFDRAGWEGRGKALNTVYKYMGVPVQRIELNT